MCDDVGGRAVNTVAFQFEVRDFYSTSRQSTFPPDSPSLAANQFTRTMNVVTSLLKLLKADRRQDFN